MQGVRMLACRVTVCFDTRFLVRCVGLPLIEFHQVGHYVGLFSVGLEAVESADQAVEKSNPMGAWASIRLR